jgi:hypothetical protein
MQICMPKSVQHSLNATCKYLTSSSTQLPTSDSRMYNDISILPVYQPHDGGRKLFTVVFWAEMSSVSTMPTTPTLLANVRLHKHAASGVA